MLLSVEHGRPEQRGRNASWAQMGPSLGTLLATERLRSHPLMSPDAFLGGGWRLPFFASVALVAFGLWVRSGVAETPLFRRLEREQRKRARPSAKYFDCTGAVCWWAAACASALMFFIR